MSRIVAAVRRSTSGIRPGGEPRGAPKRSCRWRKQGVERVEAGRPVMADPSPLEQVFLNLLTNALKFTRPAAASRPISASPASVEWRGAASGRGIDPWCLQHVFARFRQADSTTARRVGGLGLGLFIARHFVEAQGGTIRAQSDGLGCGATVVVSLPVAQGLGEASRTPANGRNAEDAGEPVDGGLLHGVRVLLVDDEPDAREMMAAVLEASGATVASAASAADALEALTGRDFDVVLTDIAMPGQDGYQLIQSIRESSDARLAPTPAAAVTACASDDDGTGRWRRFQAHLAKTDPSGPAHAGRRRSRPPPGHTRPPPTPSRPVDGRHDWKLSTIIGSLSRCMT